MHLPTLITLSFFLGSASVWARGCATLRSQADVLDAERSFLARQAVTPSAHRKRQTKAPIKVYFHVISKDGTPRGGNVSDSVIETQVRTLNAPYYTTGLTFELAGIDRTVNATLFAKAGPGSVWQTEMKAALRKGGVSDLNVYSVGFEDEDLRDITGYATYPWEYEANPQDDGVVLNYLTLPGGSFIGHNFGHILTHEAGHWFGLWHTFEGGCEGVGDSVADTPAEASAGLGCPNMRDSCPDQPGRDPIENFMDESDDGCKWRFTTGQSERIHAAITAYRAASNGD